MPGRAPAADDLPVRAGPGLGIVRLDGVRGGTFLDSPADLDARAMAFTRLRASALDPGESSSVLMSGAVQLVPCARGCTP